MKAGDARARTRFYRRTLVEEWALTAAVMALTLANARPLATLGLRAPEGWRLWLGAAIPLVYGLLVIMQGRALAGKPKTLAKLREKLQPLRALVPHTPGEYRLFVPLSITAGICEELLFRGFIVWVLQNWIGLFPAAAVSMVLFGLGHFYQGAKFGVRAFAAGVVMGVLALVTRSIVPGMVLHALIDIGSGYVTYLAMREPAAPVGGAAGAGGTVARGAAGTGGTAAA